MEEEDALAEAEKCIAESDRRHPLAQAEVICDASDLCKMIREELRSVFREFQASQNFKPPEYERGPKSKTDLMPFSADLQEQRAHSEELPHACETASPPPMKNAAVPRRQPPIPNLPGIFQVEDNNDNESGTGSGSGSLLPNDSIVPTMPLEHQTSGKLSPTQSNLLGTKSSPVVGGKSRNKKGQVALMDFGTDGTTTFLQRLTLSRGYETFSATLIVTNALFIGWQAQHLAEWYRDEAARLQARGEEEHFDLPPVIFLVGNVIFAILFTAELLLRWMSDGFIDFFKTDEINWNVLDVLVVFVGIVESVLDSVERATDERSGGVLQNISTMRMLRILRVVRVVRVIRVMKFFRELRMMVYSIMGSMKNLMWVMVILGVTFYLFGITFTSAVTNELVRPVDYTSSKYEDLNKYFGTVDKSILALFMSMSGGNDWIVYYNALALLPYQYMYFFLLFIVFTLFAIVNIVTGVFVESALQSNHKDRDIIAHEELVAKKRYLESMQDIFEEMDTDEQGTINVEEFEGKLQDERVVAYFNALKLDVSDARTLFQLIDTDESGEITIDEFIVGCYKLQGESRSLDLKFMQFEVKALSGMSKELHGMVVEISRHLFPESSNFPSSRTKSSQEPGQATANRKQLFDKTTLESETRREMRKTQVNIESPAGRMMAENCFVSPII